MKNIKKSLFFAFFFLMVFTFALSFFVPSYLNSPVDSSKKETMVEFRVENGESIKSVIKRLKRDGIIRSEIYAYLYTKWKKYKIKRGIYDFSLSFSTNEIIRMLSKGGREELIKITIPEGLTIKKTARLFENAGVCKSDEFISCAKNPIVLHDAGLNFNSAEGFLFPDTYLLSKKDDAESIVRMMIKNFFIKTANVPNFPKKNDDVYRAVKLASIIEREYQLEEEAPIISGVFENRLNIKMPLQSCATVEYIITEIEGKPHPKRLFWEDTQIKNEYNTYINQGLPPSPIASPGLVSLSAACNPKKTDYLYFRLVDSKVGRHAFSTNVRDHNKIGNVYLKK